jgi:hypothetical protein
MRMVRPFVTQMPRICMIARSGLLSLVALTLTNVAPCMAQSPDPFRSAPAPVPDSFRSAPAAAPVKAVTRPHPPRPAREAAPLPEPILAVPTPVTVVTPSPAPPAVARPAGPPLEVSVAGMSENGASNLVVVYHGNGTFDLTVSGSSFTSKGVWWWATDGRFCFRMDKGDKAGENTCKSNGHLIGRVDLSGHAIPRTYP